MDTCKYCLKGFNNLNLHYSKTKTCLMPQSARPEPKTLYDYLGNLKASDTINGRPAWEVIDGLTQEEKEAPAANEGGSVLNPDFKVYVYLPGMRLPIEAQYSVKVN
jgi:hypothetical protein